MSTVQFLTPICILRGLLSTMLLLATWAHADVYRCTEKSKTMYQDHPCRSGVQTAMDGQARNRERQQALVQAASTLPAPEPKRPQSPLQHLNQMGKLLQQNGSQRSITTGARLIREWKAACSQGVSEPLGQEGNCAGDSNPSRQSDWQSPLPVAQLPYARARGKRAKQARQPKHFSP